MPAAEKSFPDDPALWPRIREERIRTLLPVAMERGELDAWVVLARENANDPLAAHIGAENAGGLAAFLFLLKPDGSLESLALSPETESTALSEVTPLDSVRAFARGENVYALVAEELRARDPLRIGVNSGPRSVADGLSWTQREALERALGPEMAARLVPSADMVVEWLSVKLPEEVEIMRRAAALTEELEREAYARIVPGETTDADVARYLKRRMAELGVTDGWAPDQNPNVNSGPDRGHSHATGKVIQPGDVIQTDFGVKVHDRWVTDIQRFAYVLGPGETEPPAEILGRWEEAKAGGRAAFEAMRPGATGWDVDRAQRSRLESNGSIPIIWSTGHPVGYWAHDLGPRLGGSANGDPARGDASRPLREGQTFAFDGFYGWQRDDGTTKTISVEEMAVVTEDGAEYLIPPQEDLILIPTAAQEAVCHDQWAAWSPDGKSIVFSSTISGDNEIYTLRLSSGALKRLTDVAGRDAHPSFSPDGLRIAFQSPRGGEDTHLYVMNRDGSEVRQITDLAGFSGMPVWSPDGEHLAFQHRSPAPDAKWTLRVVRLADGSIEALTDGTADDQVVNWEPDGTRLLFHSDRTGTNQVHLWEDGETRQLTRGPAEHRNATWSPDGERIALRSTRDGEPGIYIMDSTGLEPVRVGTVSPEHGVPFFSPDGSRLLLTPTTPDGTRIRTMDVRTGLVEPVDAACTAG